MVTDVAIVMWVVNVTLKYNKNVLYIKKLALSLCQKCSLVAVTEPNSALPTI